MKRVSFELGYTASDVSKSIADAKIASVVISEDGSCIASGSVQLPSLEEPSWRISPFVETSVGVWHPEHVELALTSPLGGDTVLPQPGFCTLFGPKNLSSGSSIEIDIRRRVGAPNRG